MLAVKQGGGVLIGDDEGREGEGAIGGGGGPYAHAAPTIQGGGATAILARPWLVPQKRGQQRRGEGLPLPLPLSLPAKLALGLLLLL